jgi:hypothetical protein
MITRDSLEWTSDDAANFRIFLDTPTGRRLLPKALESLPALLPSGDSNAILIRSGEVRGFQIMTEALLSLTSIAPAPVVEESAYPPLEDDRSWKDGQKLN